MVYGNDTYPESRRIFSRPFPCYFRHLYDRKIDKELSEFRDTLHDIGEGLIGKPFDYCLDVDAYPAAHFSPPYWDEDKVVLDLADAKEEMRAGLSQKVQTALDNIVDHISQAKIKIPAACAGVMTANYSRSLQRKTPYDVPFLIANFKILWQHDIMLDPRLTQAESMFFHGHEQLQDSNAHRDQDRLLASLAWMSQPENARRIGQMFLYSRLAQHYGETDPRSFEFAHKVADEIDNGSGDAVVQKLQTRPQSYYAETMSVHQSLVSMFMERVYVGALSVLPLKMFFGGDWRTGPGSLLNTAALGHSAQDVVDDYRRLTDGSWARTERDLLRSRNVKQDSVITMFVNQCVP